MKSRIVLVLTFVVLLALSACTFNFNTITGSGNVITQTRTVSNFTSLSLNGVGDITVTQDDTEALSIQAEDNIAALITTEVKNGALVIGLDRNETTSIRPTKPVKFDLHVKTLDSIILSGAANLQAASLKGNRFSFTINGTGNIKIGQLDGTEVNSTVNGAGNVELGGQAPKQTAGLNGAGSYRATDLKSDSAIVAITGAGSATLWVNQSLDVTISGAGSVNYYGNAKVTQKISGAGSVKNLGNK